jgi:hypothetical protein
MYKLLKIVGNRKLVGWLVVWFGLVWWFGGLVVVVWCVGLVVW